VSSVLASANDRYDDVRSDSRLQYNNDRLAYVVNLTISLSTDIPSYTAYYS